MYRSIALRRFTSTARSLRPSSGKPPPPERDDPPRPPSEPKPNENDRQKEEPLSFKEDLRIRILGTFQPRSPHFILAAFNPRLSKEQRTKSGLLLIGATLTTLLLEPYYYKAVVGEANEDSHRSWAEVYLDYVRDHGTAAVQKVVADRQAGCPRW